MSDPISPFPPAAPRIATGARRAAPLPTVWWRADAATLAFLEVVFAGGAALGWDATQCRPHGALLHLLHQDHRDELERRLRTAARDGGTADLECNVVAADASVRCIRVCAIARLGADGTTTLEGVLLDVDPGFAPPGSLSTESARLQAMLDGERIGTWQWNCVTNETVVNERWASLLGYTLAEIEPVGAATWTRLAHPDDLELARSLTAKLAGGDVDEPQCELRLKAKDGRWLWFLARGRIASRTADGRPLWTWGTIVDIQEAKRRELQLQANAQLLNGLARLQREFLVDPDPRTSFDRMLAFLLDATESEYGFIGEVHRRANGEPYLRTWAITNIAWDDATRAFYEANAPKGMEFGNLQSLFGAVLKTHKVVVSNAPLLDPRRGGTPDGHPPLVAFLGLPLFFGDEMIGMIGIANRNGGYDEALIQWLEPLTATCSGLVHSRRLARQKELSNAQQRELETQLQQAQKLESLGLLAGGIAHDFNNLLTSILGRAELALLELAKGSGAYEHIERAVEGAQRAGELVNQMLAYAGKVRRGAESLDLSVVAEDMRRLLEVSMQKRCTLRAEYSTRLPRVLADAAQLRQVLMNLVINAGEATSERGGHVVIRTGCEDYDAEMLRDFDPLTPLVPGQYVYIEVEDDGSGMDAATQARIFEPFFTTKFSGRGLGLSAVLGIVRNHGGSLRCTSTLGVGTKFRVILPASDAESAADGERSATAAPADPWHSNAVVLLVDDDAMVRSVAQHLLAEIGCRVLVARDGAEALAVHERHRGEIALVLLDLTMPGLSGEEVLRELRRRGSDVGVVLTSGYHEQSLGWNGSATNIEGFLHKPYTRATFREVLRLALQSRDRPEPL